MSSPNSQLLHWHYTELKDHDFQIGGRTLFFLIILFSVVLVVVLLFLYARWILPCRQVYFHNTPPTHAPLAPPQKPQGLSLQAIRAIPVVLFSGGDSGNTSKGTSDVENECCICLGVIEDGDKVKVLPGCSHCFHCCCVNKWLTGQASCPLCRAPVRGESELVLDVDTDQ